ncbi:MAG: aminodeoxychorismate lyase [Aquificae bacterium]|nr:aminodeoxychorismate lyase [Aquificota bacterium]
MKKLITINGKIIEEKPYFRSLMYGEGIFETFRYEGKLPKYIDWHYERLSKGAESFKIPKITKEDFIYYIEKAVSYFEEKDLYVKTILLPEGNIPFPVVPYKSNLMVVVKPFKQSKKEISLTVAPFRVHSSDPLLRYKTTNYLRNILAKRYALEKGFDDAVFINEKGEVTETTSANIFWIKGIYLFTPSEECGLLPGITRKAVIEKAPNLGFIVIEGRFPYEDLKKADYIFVTNALNGIIKVSKLDILAN